jgi:hypothetical protein
MQPTLCDTASMKLTTPRRYWLTLSLGFALLTGFYYSTRTTEAFTQAEDRDRPAGPLEEQVAQRVIRDFDVDVVFTRWGPHLRGPELLAIPDWQNAEAVLRVRFVVALSEEAPQSVQDLVFSVQGSQVKYQGKNLLGDAWKEAATRGELPYNPRLFGP